MPDLNTNSASPHTLPRRSSVQQMPPPSVPASSSTGENVHILPSNQQAVNSIPTLSAHLSSQVSPYLPSQALLGSENSFGTGPGPLRHPRPMTAAEMHLQLEKEQEAVVNRLTRELSLLRVAQNASVVSNASSNSTNTEPSNLIATPSESASFSHPRTPGVPLRHNRTSSNASSRSLHANVGSVSAASLAGMSGVSSPAPVRPIPIQHQQQNMGGISLSRQNSAASSRRSRAASPSPASFGTSMNPPSTHFPECFVNRSAPAAAGSEAFSPSIMPATQRYEETAFYRAELDSVKRENEALKRRVRDLEKMVRERMASDERTRSEGVGTTASVAASMTGTVAGTPALAGLRPRIVSTMSASGSVGVGVPEEELQVGESAASSGMH